MKVTVRVGSKTVHAHFWEHWSFMKIVNEVWKLCCDFHWSLDYNKEDYSLVITAGDDKNFEPDFVTYRLHNLNGIAVASTVSDYDDNRCYRTGERQLDTRIDGQRMRA